MDCLLPGLVKGVEDLLQHPILDTLAEFPVAEHPLEDLPVLFHAVQEFTLDIGAMDAPQLLSFFRLRFPQKSNFFPNVDFPCHRFIDQSDAVFEK